MGHGRRHLLSCPLESDLPVPMSLSLLHTLAQQRSRDHLLDSPVHFNYLYEGRRQVNFKESALSSTVWVPGSTQVILSLGGKPLHLLSHVT